MKNFKILIALLFICTSTDIFAQTGNSTEARGGSVYSSIGVGFPIDNTSSGLLSQGIIGLTNINRETSSLANPGLWAETFYTQAGTGLQLTRSNVESLTSAGTNVNLETGYIHLLLPVKPGKIGLSVGLYPVTRANYRSVNANSFMNTPTNEIEYTNEVQSFGGMNKFEIGIGFKVGENFSFGYAPSVAFLTLKNSEALDFNVLGYLDHSQETDYSGAAFAQRFGFTGTFTNLFSDEDRFSIGGSINLPYTLEVSKDFTSIKNVEGFDQEVKLNEGVDEKGDITMPFEATFGVGYAPSIITNFSIEGQIQNWSGFENELDRSSELLMNDRFKIGFGGQYHPYRQNLDTFLSGFKYSAGLSYDSGHLSISGEDIQTLWLNTGIGIPSKVASFIDISVQYGLRGTTTNNLFEERIWAFGFSVNLTELMFVRPKLR